MLLPEHFFMPLWQCIIVKPSQQNAAGVSFLLLHAQRAENVKKGILKA